MHLEGSVRKANNRVRIPAQLIDAATGYHLWAERYDRDLQDIFAVQDEIAWRITRALAVRLTREGRADGTKIHEQRGGLGVFHARGGAVSAVHKRSEYPGAGALREGHQPGPAVCQGLCQSGWHPSSGLDL